MKLQDGSIEEERSIVAFYVAFAALFVGTAGGLVLMGQVFVDGQETWRSLSGFALGVLLSVFSYLATHHLLGFYALVHGAEEAREPVEPAGRGEEQEEPP